MQSKKNKLARASWKYHFFQKYEVEDYINFLTDSYFEEQFIVSRNVTITKLNFFKQLSVSTGKFIVDKAISKHHIGHKVGQFTKTRKPFYFRSKKKKKCYKKIQIITYNFV